MPATTHILHESRTKLPEYAEACYIAENIEYYANLKGGEIPQKYTHLAITDPNTIDSTAILNGLRGHGAAGQNFFQDVPKSIAGDFQPWIKIYKVIPGSAKKDNDKDIIIPLKFNNLKNLDMMDSSKLGVAFRSFTFDYEGTRPVEVDTYLRCSLKLYFESPQALFKQYTHKKHKHSFADLIRRTVPARGLSSDQQHLVYDGTSFRIRVDIGYTPPSVERLTDAYREAGFDNPKKKARGLRYALLSNKMQLYLNLTKHSINPVFDAPDGGFELTADYIGAIETSFRSKKADILFTPEDPNSRKREMTLKKHELDKQNAAFVGLNQEQKDSIRAFTESKQSFKDLVQKQIVPPEKAGDFDTAEEKFAAQQAVKTAELNAQKKVLSQKFSIEPPVEGQAPGLMSPDISKIISYLGYRDQMNSTDVGQTIMHAKKMSRMYSQILDRLTEKKQLHFIQIPESDLFTWFGAKRSKAKAQEDSDRLEEVNKEIAEINAKESKSEEDLAKLTELNTEKQVLEAEAAAETRRNKAAAAPAPKETGVADSKASDESKEAMEQEAKQAAAEELAKQKAEEEDTQPNSKIPFTEMETPAALKDRNIYFFYYGDLLDVVLEILYELKDSMDLDWWSTKNKTGNIKFLLGEVEFTHPQKRVLVKENLARIPITLKVWQEFWIENVIDQWRTEYLFDSFLNDTLSQLVIEALTGRCKDEGNVNVNILGYPSYLTLSNINNKVVFSTRRAGGKVGGKSDKAYYYSYGATPEDPEEGEEGEASNDAKKLRAGELIFVQAASNSGQWFKNRSTDIRRGVYHLELGRENSTILNFTMNRSNQPHYLEAKLEAQGIDDTHAFGEPYNYDITMYGNSLLIPGKHLKVTFPITWFSSKQQKSLGLGGYCMVLKTKNEVKAIDARLEWTTNMQCLWQSFGGRKPPVAGSGHGSKPIYAPSRGEPRPGDPGYLVREDTLSRVDNVDPADSGFVPIGQKVEPAATYGDTTGGIDPDSEGLKQLAAEQAKKKELLRTFAANNRKLGEGGYRIEETGSDGTVTTTLVPFDADERKALEHENKQIQEQLRAMKK